MIKSDFGTIEVNGREPVIMAEFEILFSNIKENSRRGEIQPCFAESK